MHRWVLDVHAADPWCCRICGEVRAMIHKALLAAGPVPEWMRP